MTEAWIVIALLVPATALIKAAGPVALGGRPLPGRAAGIIALLAPALLAALVVVEILSDEQRITVDERVFGLAGAAGVLALGRGLVPAVLAAAAVTAAARALL